MKKQLITVAASAVMALSLSSNTSAEVYRGGYAGVSVGQTDIDIDGFDEATSFKFRGGYRFNQNLAIEAAFIDFGEAEDDFGLGVEAEADGFNFSVLGLLPVQENFDLFAKFGVLMWDAKVSGAGVSDSDDGTDFGFGVGAQFRISDQFGFVAEFERFEFDDIDADTLSIGVLLHL